MSMSTFTAHCMSNKAFEAFARAQERERQDEKRKNDPFPGNIPHGKLTEEELASIDTSGWTRYVCRDLGTPIDRFRLQVNTGYWWSGGELYGNITAQCRPGNTIQAIFYRDENGIRMTQPVELMPTYEEMKKIERAESDYKSGRF